MKNSIDSTNSKFIAPLLKFRGCVLGQQGLYIDKQALRAESYNFNVDEFIQGALKLQSYVAKHGPVKF